MRAVILAGGKGSRLFPYTTLLPKPLVPLGDKTLMEILIHRLKNHGFDQITICIKHLAPLIRSYFKNGKEFGVKIDYSLETKSLGSVGPLTLIKNLPKTFLVANCDLLTSANFQEMINEHRKAKAKLTLGIYNRQERIDQGVVVIKNCAVVKYQEKPTFDFSVCAGLFIFEKEILNLIKNNTYCDFPQLVNLLLKKEWKVAPFQINGICLDVGRPDDYQHASEEYIKNPNLFLK